MNRKNMDDIFRDGLKNYNSDIDPNEIWAGIQDKKPNPSSDSKKPFAWWILGALLLAVSTTMVLSSIASDQRNTIETANARVSNMSVLNTSNESSTIQSKKVIENKEVAKVETNSAIPTTIAKKNKFINTTSDISAQENTLRTNNNDAIVNPTTSKVETSSSFINTNQNTNIDPFNTNSNTAPYPPTIPVTNYNNKKTSQPFESEAKINKVIAFEFLNKKEVIPVIPMTDEEENLEETEIADMSIPEDKIAEGCYGGPTFKFAVGAHISPDLVMHRISSTNQDLFPYIDERRKTEKLLESYHGGLDVYLQHKDGLFLRSGIEYSQINKRFQFNETWEIPNDSTNSVTTYTREKKTTNRYRMIDIPLTVGYEFGINNDDLSLYVEGGASMNVLFKKKGDILNPNSGEFYEPISITDGEENSLDGYVDNIGLSIIGGIGIRYELLDGVFLYAQPAGKLYLNAFTKKDNDVNEKFSRFGLNLGAIYRL